MISAVGFLAPHAHSAGAGEPADAPSAVSDVLSDFEETWELSQPVTKAMIDDILVKSEKTKEKRRERSKSVSRSLSAEMSQERNGAQCSPNDLG